MRKVSLGICLLFLFSLVIGYSNAYADMGGFAHVEGVEKISQSEAEKRYKNKTAIFIDVNTDEVRTEQGYIPDSIFASIEALEQVLPKNKDAFIIFYATNRLSYEPSLAAKEAIDLGYKNVYVMIDGLEGWITSGRPVRKTSVEDWKSAKNVYDFNDGIHKDIQFGELPSCRSCHGVKSIVNGKKAVREDKASDKMQINKNCVQCHDDLGSQFEGSVHNVNYKALLDGTLLYYNTPEPGKKQQPLCVDCHTVHTADKRGVHSPKKVSSDSCIKCHEKVGKLYLESFHGKANVLEKVGETPTIASCGDCHGGHNVFKVDDPRSTLFGKNRVETCAKCHEGSHPEFANFIAHADHNDSKKHPVLYWINIIMMSLLIVVFTFFGIHTILWAIRLFIIKSRNPAAWKLAKEAAHHDKKGLKRFGFLHRLQHLGLAISFMGLSITGMPQKFYEAPWAQGLTDLIGGPINAATLHHYFAALLGILFLTHVIDVAQNLWRKRDRIRDEQGKLSFKLFLRAMFGPDSLIPNLQDLRDIRDNFKWFLGKGERPTFDRWAYWEKFDYIAEIWGTFVFGITGLILLYPVEAASILPGSAVNGAIIFHTYEGLLAMGFIFSIHFFNSHFRLDKFPMDMVIFLGNVPVEEANHERGKWMERLRKENRLDEFIEDQKSGIRDLIAKIIGFSLMGLGLVLLALIVYALII